MTFRCPGCAGATLEIIAGMALPADSRSDEIVLQVIACSACGLRGLAAYEESRRGALDSEAWEHTAVRLHLPLAEAVAAQIAACPAPFDLSCTCPAHRVWGTLQPGGRWAGLPLLSDAGGSWFMMEQI